MAIQEYRRVGEDGKVVPGVTILRDPQTGQEFDVLGVVSGRMPTPIDETVDRRGPSAGERCAMYGTPSRFTDRGPARWIRKRPGAP